MSCFKFLTGARRRKTWVAGVCAALAFSASALRAAEQTPCEMMGPGARLQRVTEVKDGIGLSVLILPGASGLAPFRDAYAAYAQALAEIGVQAYLVDYYSEAEAALMPNPPAGFDYPAHMRCWAQRVSSTVTALSKPPFSARRVALLAFSQGARVAVAVAAANPQVERLATLYGRLPRDEERLQAISHLPPLLNLHGDADRLVPIEEGRRLVSHAQALGTEAVLVPYPGEGHGFDFAQGQAAAEDARRRVLAFFRAGIPPRP